MRKLTLALCATALLCTTAISTPALATNAFDDATPSAMNQGDVTSSTEAISARANTNPASLTHTGATINDAATMQGRDSSIFTVTDTINGADAGGLVSDQSPAPAA